MKKRLLAFAMALTLLLGMSQITYADSTMTVVADENGNVSIQNSKAGNFTGMAPGETRVQKIKIENRSKKTLNFYVAEKTLQTLEQSNETAGGAYHFDVSVGDNVKSATSILSQLAGGYKGTEGSDQGLEQIDSLSGENGVFLTQLDAGDSTYMFISLTIYGEGNNNVGKSNYANAVGNLQFAFGAEPPTNKQTNPTVITRIHTTLQKNPVYKYVTTGDRPLYLLYFSVMTIGVIFVIIGAKKKKKGEA